MRTLPPVAVIGGGLLLVVLSACSIGSGDRRAGTWSVSAAGASGAAGAAGEPGEPGQPGQPGQPGEPGSAAVSVVSCTVDSCTVTLGGDATAHVLGVTFSLQDIRDGRATVRVQNRDVSGTPGETVSAGPLTLRFTAVTDDTVSFTASRE